MSVVKFNLNNEIRRISVQKQPTFEEVSEILKRLYGAKLAEVDFALRYLDSEGDVVTVSSTEELEEAFRNFSKSIARFSVFPIEKEEEDDDDEDDEEPSEEDVRNLFAALLGLPRQQTKPTCPLLAKSRCGPKPACPRFAQRGPCFRPQPTPQPAAKEEKVVHRAFCDHCDTRIVGLRFKCSNCPDFDLCEKCLPSKNEKHDPSHIFVKIAYPSQYICIRRAPKQETAKTEEAKPTSIPIKVTVPEEKTEEAKTEPEAPQEVDALTELAKEAEAEAVAKEAETVPEVADEEKKKEISPFEAKLVQLEEMGFADRERNIQTLVNRSGDLVKTIRDLLA